MILRGARVALSGAEAIRADVGIRDGRVSFNVPRRDDAELDLEGYLLLPGLINAHDHLEFNLFPQLGRGPYPNATAWAADIYRPEESPVREHLRIPKRVRLLWGGIKNLLDGVTSVLHHNPYDAALFGDSAFPVRVISRFGWAHSLQFSPDISERFRRTPRGAPFIVHAGEGTDSFASDELTQLDRAGVLGGCTVIVHGVALDAAGVALLKKRNSAIIWCPASNLFTLGRTLSQVALDSGIPIALGTDSALTARGGLHREAQLAMGLVGPFRLYEMVTSTAAAILRLDCGQGTIREGGIADLLVVRDRGGTPAEVLQDIQPELVFVGGQVKLVRDSMPGLPQFARFQPLEVEGRGRWHIDCDLASLAAAVRNAIGPEFRLAGRKVAA